MPTKKVAHKKKIAKSVVLADLEKRFQVVKLGNRTRGPKQICSGWDKKPFVQIQATQIAISTPLVEQVTRLLSTRRKRLYASLATTNFDGEPGMAMMAMYVGVAPSGRMIADTNNKEGVPARYRISNIGDRIKEIDEHAGEQLQGSIIGNVYSVECIHIEGAEVVFCAVNLSQPEDV